MQVREDMCYISSKSDVSMVAGYSAGSVLESQCFLTNFQNKIIQTPP